MCGAKRCASAGEQKPQVVVNFRHRTDGGAWVVAGGLLFDGNGRAQALDHVHIGLVHQLQKLPCVGGQALHITALSFGIERVKRQTGLARATQSGDHHQLVAWNINVHVLQIVRTRPANADFLRC